jgi:hypothetical protein
VLFEQARGTRFSCIPLEPRFDIPDDDPRSLCDRDVKDRRLRGNPFGVGLDWPEHGGILHRSGSQSTPTSAATARASTVPASAAASKFRQRYTSSNEGGVRIAGKMTAKFNPLVLDENYAAVTSYKGLPQRAPREMEIVSQQA